MSFQTSCMLFVGDEQQQIEIQKWMNNIGWQILGRRDSKHCVLVADTDQNAVMWLELDRSARACFSQDYYDCGENIEMFKALTAMNSDNDREQWFTDGMDWRLCHDSIVTKMMIPSYTLYHKATAAEIIEHFKDK